MADSESDYSSSSEGDEDYVPSGEESGDDLEGAVVDEDELDRNEESKTKKSSAKSKNDLTHKRRGWSALADEESKNQDPEVEKRKQEEEKLKKVETEKKAEEQRKKKADDLWSSFLSDVGKRPKSSTTSEPKPKSKESSPALPKPESKSKSNGDNDVGKKTLQVTQVLDFAGEEVRVTKELDASSAEGKKYLKQQEEASSNESPSNSTPSSTNSLLSKVPGLSGLKRPGGGGGGLGNVLGQIGKKKKISTLEKSKLDWESFKTSQGIGEELKIHNKGKEGYVEKQRFLERTDVRQYEKERDMRLSQSKINR